ncbi:ASKHA domain-containing protein [Clostridium ihumii]|uniref:ASKHA domain-containing protein n=1 Tax=Clostridium ihumii TaxID=1470356 RepID=UPI00054F9621|nr:ASKHA domain-containing protein [Clostridium ihumii]
MPKVYFKDKNLYANCEIGSTLLECIRENNLKLETPCNAIGICGKCKVIAIGDLTKVEENELPFINIEKNERLACMAKVTGDVQVEFINKNEKLKTINRGYSIDTELLPEIKKETVEIFDLKSSKPFIENIEKEISSIKLYDNLSNLELNNKSSFEIVTKGNLIIDIKEKIEKIFAVAIDIGTTGISSYLINLEDGAILNKISSLNPQTEFGGDVLTRITYCMENTNGVYDLKRVICEEINRLVKELLIDYGNSDEVYSICIAGNTTMLHLLLGISPVNLAKAPYRPIFLDGMNVKPCELEININSQGNILLLPNASSYVGADIVAGVIASGFNKESKSGIFIDIGTNGEIVAINNNKIMATSTAAGPALEGMNISCGCRAQEGAIESFSIDDDYNINYGVIGDCEPLGICGSGLLDLASALVKSKIVLKSGRFNKELPEIIKDKIVDKKFYITENIYISQKDIRQIQLAKGAIAAGITMLLKEINLNIEDVEDAYIAGAFGYHVNGESIKNIGLIPKGFKGKIKFLGNTSLEGARIAILNKDMFKEMTTLKENMSVLELSTSSEFQEHFIKELNF